MWKKVSEDEKLMLEFSTLYMDIRDEGVLMWPKNNVNSLCGIAVTTFSNLSGDSEMMKIFNESATSKRAGLQVLRDVIDVKIQNFPLLKNKNSICDNYKCDLVSLCKPLVTRAVNTRASSIAMILSRIEEAKKHILRVAKTLKKKQACNLDKAKE